MFEEGKKYTISELTQILKESTSESKPKIDAKVIKDNAQNNVKAVKDIMKQTSDYNSVKSSQRDTNPENIVDYNRTPLDVKFTTQPSKEYNKRVEKLAKGYDSDLNAEIHEDDKPEENGGVDRKGNKDFYDVSKKKNSEINKVETAEKHAGLKSHNLPKPENKTVFTTESKKMKRLHFSHTVFLNEEQMLKKIPEDYKIDGNKFYMKDSKGCEYLVECHKHPCADYIYTEVVGYNNPEKLNEDLQRIKALASYQSSSFNTSSTPTSRLNEDKKLDDLLHTCKTLSESVKK